jgi:hypothetical protein
MKTLKQFKEEYQIDERYDKDLDADGNGKLTKKDFELLRAKKKKSDCCEESKIEEEDRTTDIMSFLKGFPGVKPRGSVADQKAARDALIAKRKETNPNPPQLGSSSSDKYKLGDYDKKSNRSYSEEFELDEISNDLANRADRMRTNRQHAAYDTSQEAGEKSSIKAAATHKLVTNTIARNQRMKNGPAILKPEAMSGTASLAFQGSKTRKEDYDFDEGYDSREAYDSWDPKHPDFVKNYKKYQKDNAGKGSMKDFIDKEKARPTRLPK